MANRLYREEAYLEKLELLLRTAKELAACRAQLEALDRRGVPEGSVIFSRPVKRYRRKNGEETVYRYTCEYLYIKGKKYYQIANGEISAGTVITLREVKIGDAVLRNVDASVVKSQKAPLLLGQSAMERFGTITIDNINNKLLIKH